MSAYISLDVASVEVSFLSSFIASFSLANIKTDNTAALFNFTVRWLVIDILQPSQPL